MPVLVAAALFVAQAPVTLLFQPKVGATYKFSMSQTTVGQAGDSGYTGTNIQEIVSESKGFYKVVSSMSEVKMQGAVDNADEARKAMEKSTSMSIDKYGAIKIEGKGTAFLNELVSGISSQSTGVQFPKEAIKTGESWTNKIDLGSVLSSMMQGVEQTGKATGDAKIVCKLVKIEDRDAVVTCDLDGTVSMAMKNPQDESAPITITMSVKGTGKYSVELATGVLRTSSVKLDTVIGVAGQNYSVAQNIVLKRL